MTVMAQATTCVLSISNIPAYAVWLACMLKYVIKLIAAAGGRRKIKPVTGFVVLHLPYHRQIYPMLYSR